MKLLEGARRAALNEKRARRRLHEVRRGLRKWRRKGERRNRKRQRRRRPPGALPPWERRLKGCVPTRIICTRPHLAATSLPSSWIMRAGVLGDKKGAQSSTAKRTNRFYRRLQAGGHGDVPNPSPPSCWEARRPRRQPPPLGKAKHLNRS